jgi:hypothetical protein
MDGFVQLSRVWMGGCILYLKERLYFPNGTRRHDGLSLRSAFSKKNAQKEYTNSRGPELRMYSRVKEFLNLPSIAQLKGKDFGSSIGYAPRYIVGSIFRDGRYTRSIIGNADYSRGLVTLLGNMLFGTWYYIQRTMDITT